MRTNILQAKKAQLALFVLLMPLLASAQVKVEFEGIWYNLDAVTKQAEVTYKGSSSSSASYSGSITIPSAIIYSGKSFSVASIGDNAFYRCSSLTSITIPEGVTSIGEYAFNGCSSLTAITIPEGVTSIGRSAFSSCSSLTSITLPEGVTSIGEYAFSSCSKLATITIPEGVTSIGSNAFSSCTSLATITIPEGVTSIGEYAFQYCSSLATITIPEGVTSIGEYAFSHCSSLVTITIPEGVTSIGDNAFQYCSSLVTITIPEGVTGIGSYAFYDCKNLADVTLPASVMYIGDHAFDRCSKLRNIYCYATDIPLAATYAFRGTNSYQEHELRNITLHVPTNSMEIYQTSSPWNGFGKYEILNLAVKKITLNHTSATLIEGDILTLTATVSPENADDSSLTWTSDNEAVAMVDSDGKVVAMGVGTTIITATANDGSGVSASCEMTVERKVTLVSEIILSHTSATLMEGETLTLTATVTPEDADDTSVTWSSSDEEVAIVSSKGKVIVMGLGTATITATANDGSGVSASCEIIVKAPILGKCATPTINYIDGEIILTCSTEGAEIKTIVVTENDNEFVGEKFDFLPTHTFTAYATKENYEDSDVATLTICWIPCSEAHESEETSILTIPSKPVLISARDGVLTLSGLTEDTIVTLYTPNGAMVAQQQSSAGEVSFTVASSQVYIVHINDKVVKIGM